MNILVLSGSPRKGGNTDLLVESFVKGASQKHQVEVVSVHDYKSILASVAIRALPAKTTSAARKMICKSSMTKWPRPKCS